jgi:protein arginine kinase activator
MLCERCGENEAIIHLTQIENNQMNTSHLCEGCASEKGLDTGASAGSYPLSDFIAQVGKATDTAPPTPCPYCGMKLEEFKKLGRLGCPQCYVAFEPHLKGLLRRLHSGTQHLGKVYLPPDPTQAERQERLAGLRRKLDHAVESEDFERAAQIRDMIRTLEEVA